MTTSRTLILAAPIDRWDEAIPLGNGLLGGLLWGQNNLVKLSLDRGDLWDLRTPETYRRPDWNWATIVDCAVKNDHRRMVDLFEKPYGEEPTPTKIGAGRIELVFPKSDYAELFSLDLGRALGRATVGKAKADVFFSAAEPVIMIRVTGAQPRCRVVLPSYGVSTTGEKAGSLALGSVGRLGYPAPKSGKTGAVNWALQTCAQSLQYAIVWSARHSGRTTQIAVAVTSTRDHADPVAEGCKIVNRALEIGYDGMLKPHVHWWKAFWAQSRVAVPDASIQQHYDMVQYFYGAASRRGAPPIPLQGVWTADEGTLPPWKGDYHNDLNTQLTYWAYLSADHLDEGLCFLDFLWNLLPAARDFARRFFNMPGACLPGVMGLDGQALGGWTMYSYAPTNTAWLAHAFYLHWRYTVDAAFLKERAYPWCAEVGVFFDAFLQPGKDGKLKLPLSNSPEIHSNEMAAWLTPNSNFDLALLRWLFAALAEMADALGEAAHAQRWKNLLNQLDDLAVEGDQSWDRASHGALRLSPDESLKETHRHHSHLIALYPLGILHIEGSDRDRNVIESSLGQIDRWGTGYWCGYSFTWMACMAARTGRAEKARNMLELYLKGFVSRNGFHLNGDFRNQGLSVFRYRPFTLEGNFAAAQAVHEMLLQSWGGVVRIFPAVSESWPDVSFDNLRAEGAFRVSARRLQGRTVRLRVQAERGGELRLRNPFGKARARWNRKGIQRTGDDYVVTLGEGECLEGERRT